MRAARQIAELERECGARPFRRTGRGVVLTELGQQIAPRVRAWLADTDQLVSDITSSAQVPIGNVRVGILPSPGSAWLRAGAALGPILVGFVVGDFGIRYVFAAFAAVALVGGPGHTAVRNRDQGQGARGTVALITKTPARE